MCYIIVAITWKLCQLIKSIAYYLFFNPFIVYMFVLSLYSLCSASIDQAIETSFMSHDNISIKIYVKDY